MPADAKLKFTFSAGDTSDTYSAGDTSDLLLDCGGTVSFTESFVYLGSLLH